MLKRIISVLTAALLLMLLLPVSAADTQPRHPTPAGYSDHDYQKMADFFDQEVTVTYFGQTITMRYYEAIHYLVPSFDINDPSTWNIVYNGVQQFSTEWEEHCGELCLKSIDADPTETSFTDYAGGALDLSYCVHLEHFRFNVFRLTELDLAGCYALTSVECENNYTLASVDLQDCGWLAELKVRNCALTSLGLDGLVCLTSVYCTGNPLTEISLSETDLGFTGVSANGNGTVGIENRTAVAVPGGEAFVGWYSESGALISENAELSSEDTDEQVVIAYFGEGPEAPDPVVAGDADGSGAVEIGDALIVLRTAMGLMPSTPELIASCDIDGDGSLSVTDALSILRFAMGLISEL